MRSLICLTILLLPAAPAMAHPGHGGSVVHFHELPTTSFPIALSVLLAATLLLAIGTFVANRRDAFRRMASVTA